jgi:hypothetical protein
MKKSLQAFLLFVPGFAPSGFLVQAEGYSGVHSHDSHLHFLALWFPTLASAADLEKSGLKS